MAIDIIIDGDFTTAQVMGPPRFSQGFDRDTALYVLEQDYVQLLASFTPTALGVASTDYPTFFLASESPVEGMGGGVSKWTRTYIKKPPTRNDYSSLTYNFIGYYGAVTVNVSSLTGRARFTQTVSAREQWDFFAIPSDYATPDLIPIIQATQYYFPVGGTGKIASEFVVDAPPFNLATSPSRTVYEAWVNAGTEIVARESNLTLWKGNVWLRKTLYIKAK